MHRILAVVSLVVALGFAFSQERNGYTFASVVHFVELNEGFDVLQDAFESSGLADRFDERGPFTLFAPVDEAFGSLDEDRLAALLNDPDAMEAFLAGYLVEARLSTQELVTQARERGGTALVRTLAGTTLAFTLAGNDRLVVNGHANVVQGEIPADNGTIFVIDRLLDDASAGERGGAPLPGMGQ